MSGSDTDGARDRSTRGEPLEPKGRRGLANLMRGPRDHSVLPGGYGRSALVVGEWSPVAIRGEGYRVWDQDGRQLIDLNNNFTTLVHGHAHPAVCAAATRALQTGASFGIPNLAEMRHASALVQRIPHVDQVRYTNSGSEAVTTAIRIGRARTNRDACLLVRDAYHGTSDLALAASSRRHRGIPVGVDRDAIVVPINDVDALTASAERNANRLGVILIDLMPNQAGLYPLTDEYLAAIVRIRDAFGLVLVVDEVVSFRLAAGGLAAKAGINPDLITLGKLIGGGLPVGAVAGRAEIMSELDPFRADGLLQGGTTVGNPVTMSAGLAALELFDSDTIDRINRLGEAARCALNDRVSHCEWEVRGTGSLFRAFPSDRPHEARALQLQLWWEAFERGVLLMPNALAAVSTPMDETVMDTVVDRLGDAIVAVTKSSRGRKATSRYRQRQPASAGMLTSEITDDTASSRAR